MTAWALLPWTLVGITALFAGRRNGTGCWVMAPAALWFLLFWATGDRRLFFPFSMQLAASLGSGWHSVWVVGVFTAIRVLQGASAHVLGVELIVAAAALGAAVLVDKWGPGGVPGRLLAGAAGGVVALVGLLV